MLGYTEVQVKRLFELGAKAPVGEARFDTAVQRDQEFRAAEKELVAAAKQRLRCLRDGKGRPELPILRDKLSAALVQQGFVEVSTPTIISKVQLEKMSIGDDHYLNAQVFWLDSKKCLRPMLAPNLYSVSIDLLRIWEKPVRIFEIGSCFRKESQGAKHLNEFTMCNLVEWGLPEEGRLERMKELAAVVMEAAGIQDFGYETTDSEVYGESLDVVQGETELASGSMGPHFLDANWGIDCTWVGLGFGLERLLMTRDGSNNIHSVGKSLSYLDGVRLNI